MTTLAAGDMPANKTVVACYDGADWELQTIGNVPSGGGSMPTATAPGQIVASNAAGTAYSVVGQLFYSQSGDTLTSIESECSSACTYIVQNPQTITLSASHTLSSNVNLQFLAGGEWTVNGAFTLTIPGNVSGTLNQHFAGTSTVKFGLLESLVPVEWFGAVNDCTASGTGTDNTTGLNAAVSSLSSGQVVLQSGIYCVSGTVNITASRQGIHGAGAGHFVSGTQNPSMLMSTSATAVTLDVNGSSAPGGMILYNKFDSFSLARSVAPTGTYGAEFVDAGGMILTHTESSDSLIPYYFHNVPSYTLGVISFNQADWGYNGVTGYTGTCEGFVFSNGEQNSPTLDWNASSRSTGTCTTSYGLVMAGGPLTNADLTASNQTSYNLAYGFFVGAADFQNILFPNMVNDSDTYCGEFYGVAGSPESAVVDGGWCYANDGIVINDATGVTITNSIFYSSGIAATSSAYLTLSNNHFYQQGNNSQIVLNGVNNSSITGSTIVADGTTATSVSFASSSYNTFSSNAISGQDAIGVSFDSSSNHNTASNANSIDPTHITTPVSDAGTGNSISSGSFTAAGDLGGSGSSQEVVGILNHALPSLSSGYPHWTGSTWVFDTPSGTSPLTTKGDLFGYDTGNQRIPVGADGTFLEADSTQATGIKWGTPSGGGGSGGFPFTVIQEAQTGSFAQTASYTLTFPHALQSGGATAFILCSLDGSATVTFPSGWTVDFNQVGTTYARLALIQKTSASDTSAVFSGATSSFACYFFELSGARTFDQLSASSQADSATTLFPSITPTAGSLVFGAQSFVGELATTSLFSDSLFSPPALSSDWKAFGVDGWPNQATARVLTGYVSQVGATGSAISPPTLSIPQWSQYSGGGNAFASFSIK
jgi:hypothetical protein